MSLDLYNKGSELLTSRKPVDAPQIYTDTDLDKITVEPVQVTATDLQRRESGYPMDIPRSAQTHYHIYSGENLLYSYQQLAKDGIKSKLENNADTLHDYDIEINPEQDVRRANISKGSFTLVYNFLDQITDKLKVEEVSGDSTEIQLTLGLGKGSVDSVEGLEDIYNETTTLDLRTLGKPREGNGLQPQYVLNFGNNDLAAITNFDFTLNPRIGTKRVSARFPEQTDENGNPTRFYPMAGTDNLWIEVYTGGAIVIKGETIESESSKDIFNESYQPLQADVTITEEEVEVEVPATSGSEATTKTETRTIASHYPSTSPPDGNPVVNKGKYSNTTADITIPLKFTATGRGAKFVPDALSASWAQVTGSMEESDGKGDFIVKTDAPVYYTNGARNDDRKFPIAKGSPYFKQLNGLPIAGEIEIFQPEIKAFQTVTVKLYKPLRGDLQNGQPTIEKIVRDSYVEKVLVYPYKERVEKNNFSEPNFKIDMGTYGKSVGTDLKSWNSLLDTNLATSQQIIDKYISASSSPNINVNYSDFSEFVHYSSAVERVNNFKYKLELIESYDSRIKTLKQISGTEALTNISQSIVRKNTVVSGMDGFEKWMYSEPSSSLYSHYSGSKFTFGPWPKVKTQPPQLHSASGSIGAKYYNNLIESASFFDAMNDARLTKTIPGSITEDPLNKDYVMFIDMIGHHFDITWAYVKKLTSIHTREEHPFDGMPNNLLYDVAKSMGWKLSHGKDRAELWSYALGTDKFGNPVQSGSLASKPIEQYTHEIWRRIVNNIPYLLKSKGSARAVKALIATYGIPQTFLSIREYGGPVIKQERQFWEHDRFVYHQRFDTDNYMEVPFGKVNDIDPITYKNRDPNPIDTIELQVQQNMNRDTAIFNKGNDFAVRFQNVSSDRNNVRGNIHFYLRGNGGTKSASINNISLFDSKMGTLIVQREKSVDDITQDNEYKLIYRRHRRDDITVSHSASILIDGSTESSYNAAWTGSGTLTVGKTLPNVFPGSALYMSGSIQELRYWAQPLKDIVIDEHTLSRESYHGNSPSSSYFDLKFRFLPDSRLKNVQSYDSQPSQHPNQKISTVLDGRILSASLYNFEPDDLRGVTDEYHTKVPSAGANNIMNNKVRVEPNRLRGMLDVDQRKETSKYDSAPNDSNQLGVYLSATKMYNEDIYNHTGFFDVDDYIGDPDQREGFTEQNEQLDYLRRQVFKKYSTKNLINSTIDILARYDFSVFEQIRQTIPARVDYNSGIIIEPHILERPKVKSKAKLTKTEPFYKTVIKQIDKEPQMFIVPLETSMSTSPVPTMTYPTYETEVSGGLAPDINMETLPLSTKVLVRPKPSMTYPTYDNFDSLAIPRMTASFDAAYLTHQTQLFLTQSLVGVGEYPTYGTRLFLTQSKVEAEYKDYNTKMYLTQSVLSADYKNYTTKIEAQRSASADYTYTPDILLTTPEKVVGSFTLYNAPLKVSHSISVTKKDLEDKGLITAKIPYKPSQYKFTILIPSASGDVGFGLGWITGSNGKWNYNPIGTSVLNKRPARYARTTNYFYSSSLSASMGLSYSSSLEASQVSTDDLPLAVFNLRHLGCKMSSDSLTTNSPHTPDGKPVIEIFQADPNVLINTSQTAEEGNLDVDVLTGLTTLNIEELFISKEVFYQRRMEYKKEKTKFRREIQRLINIEEGRRAEFDLRKQNSEDISIRERARQDEYDVVNNPKIVEKEIEEKETKALITKEELDRMREERDFSMVRMLDGNPTNIEPKDFRVEVEEFGGLTEKLMSLNEEEREQFIEDEQLDKKLIEQLKFPKEMKDLRFEKDMRKSKKSERRGE